ncbi:MAG: tripartite tricarboxylate transporter substrate binding protein, partial [Burkholderiales bacterium]
MNIGSRLALAALACACCTAAVFAQNYPTGPMRIISPYPPGGGTDVLARVIGQKLNEKFGQNV